MREWCMAHPWMTLFLVFIALVVVNNVLVNVCGLIDDICDKRYRLKLLEKDDTDELQESPLRYFEQSSVL